MTSSEVALPTAKAKAKGKLARTERMIEGGGPGCFGIRDPLLFPSSGFPFGTSLLIDSTPEYRCSSILNYPF